MNAGQAKTARAVSLGYLTVYPMSPSEVVSCAARTGYQSVGFRLQSARPDGSDRFTGGRSAIVDAKKRLLDSGLTLFDVELFWLRRDIDLSHFRPALDMAAELGATWLLTGGWYEDDDFLADRLAAFAEMAHSYNLKVGLEFMPWTGISSLSQARRVLAAAAQPNAALVLDPLHLDRAGGLPADLAALSPSEIAYAQLCDARLPRPTTRDDIANEGRYDRLMPGSGSLPLGDFVQALPSDIAIAVEIPMMTPLSEMPLEVRARQGLENARKFL
jgi:sugar phosphate isomerase/epimerase